MTAPLKFEILDELGHGQFSTVYRAKWIDPPPIVGVDCAGHPPSQDTGANYHVNGGATFIDKYGRQHGGGGAQHTNGFNQNQLTQQAQPQQHHVDLFNDDLTTTTTTTTTDQQRHDAHSTATMRRNERFVALKRIKFYDIQNASARVDYLKEVKLLQQVKHPNIINFNISFIERNELFIVLELADGGDLSKLIRYFQKKKRLIPEQMILKYFTQVCSAVEYIHSKRILHRDIKPANIFMTSDGCVKLGDFGLGRFFSQNTRDAHSIVGTFYYMSPERIKETGYSFSSDVWSLGCVLYELITLSSPFSILNHEQNLAAQEQNTNPYNLQWLINRIIAAEYPSLDGYKNISPRLRHLTAECLNPIQEARPDMPYICAVVNEIKAGGGNQL